MRKNDNKHSKAKKHYSAVPLPKSSLDKMYCDSYDDHIKDDIEQLMLLCDEREIYDNYESFCLTPDDTFPKAAFDRLAEHLFDGYWLFTDIQDLPVDDEVVEELSEHLVTPHLLSASYAKYLHSHSDIKYFYNHKDRLIILSKGIYLPAAEVFKSTPGCDTRTFWEVFAVDKLPDNIDNLGCDELFELIENDYTFWIPYYVTPGFDIILTINTRKIERQEFFRKLQDACQKSGKELLLYL